MLGATPKAQQQQRRGGVGVDGLPREAPPPPQPQCVSCVVRACAASITLGEKVMENKTIAPGPTEYTGPNANSGGTHRCGNRRRV